MAKELLHLKVLAHAAPEDSPTIAAAISQNLGKFGRVALEELGIYWKVETDIEFQVDLYPSMDIDHSIERIHAISPNGWSGDVWNRTSNTLPLFHHKVYWAWLDFKDAGVDNL